MSTDASSSTREVPPPDASLMTLPAELRNEVFELSYIQRNAYTGDRKTLNMSSLLLGHKKILNNMIVNKQYQAEASVLFWGGNTFKIEQSGGEDMRLMETDSEGFVTRGKNLLFRGIAHGNNLQAKVIGTYLEDSCKKCYAVLLPPARYIPLIKNIVFRISIEWSLLAGGELEKAIKSEATNVGTRSWLRAVRNFDILGFTKMEKVTFHFVATQFEKEQRAALKKYVLDSKVDSKEVEVVFEEDVASD